MGQLAAGFAEVTYKFARSDHPESMEIVIGHEWPSGIVDADQFCNDLYDQYVTSFGADIRSDSSIYAVTMRGIPSGGGPVEQGEHIETTIGTGSVPSLTPQVALLINKRTGLAGRRHRGRIYVPVVLSEGAVDGNGVLDPTGFQVRWTAWRIAHASADRSVHILHASGDPTPTLVTELQVRSVVATQRGRLR